MVGRRQATEQHGRGRVQACGAGPDLSQIHFRRLRGDAPETAQMSLLQRIAADETLAEAFDWLCKSRQRAGHNHDIWYLRERWRELKRTIQQKLLTGTYRLEGTRLVRWGDTEVEIWSSEDSLVLKAIAIVLGRELNPLISTSCYHVADRGGVPATVQQVNQAAAANTFVFRSDVKSYYASMDHDLLLELVRELVDDKGVMDLVERYVRRTIRLMASIKTWAAASVLVARFRR